ncbi:isopenicillin N synthase family dioxygenase [Reyranella sp.]|uniref:isopenicillin N synthase family dioxygenase n=1 Tax=Reyranella sp. TaxID=1929291 RepID=UPI003D0B0077
MADIPIIDVHGLLDGNGGDAEAVTAIGRACRQVGFFYVAGHGIPGATIEAVFRHAADFFAATPAVKQTVRYTGTSGNRGWVPLGGETLDPGTAPDLKECFNIGLELAEDDPELVAGRPFRHRNPWPALAGFRTAMLDYFDRAHRLGRELHQAFALDLGVDRSYFDDKLDRPMAVLRLLRYPGDVSPVAPDQMGAGEHTDYGNLTLLATDSVGGLAVRTRAGHWIEAPTVPGTLLCNIGDCLMRWTNDVYVSTPHRVVSPRGRDRYSVAFFLDPNPDSLVACLPGCVTQGSPKYAPVLAADYLRSRLEPTYEAGGLAEAGGAALQSRSWDAASRRKSGSGEPRSRQA